MSGDMPRPRLALVHSGLVVGGGPEAITLHTIEAVRDICDIAVITYEDIDLELLNSFYGTHVRAEDFIIIKVRKPIFKKASVLRRYKISRYCQKAASHFKVMFSIYNTMDFRTRGIQYIIDPSFDSKLLGMLNPSTANRWFYKDTLFRKIYFKIGDLISNYSLDGVRKNKSIADSDWTGQLAKKYLGIDCQTIYPPVLGNKNDVAWEDRENGFVSLGRISPDKNLEKIISILRTLKKRFHDLHLHIIGRELNSEYKEHLDNYISDERDWIFLERDVTSSKKNEILSRHKFGIHGKEHEPFGISVAEMLKSGCVVWVPEGGGQVEIVNHPALTYAGVEDACLKIERVLRSRVLQKDLLLHLADQSRLFSAAKFQSDIRNLIVDFMSETGNGDPTAP